MNKKGAELTLNVVIIAIILLITVGVVISFLFSQQGKTSKALNDCESKRGNCDYDSNQACITAGGTPMPAFACDDSSKKCCLKFGS